MAITLPELPYPKDALAPHISERTLDFHHGKHHNTYVVNTNKLIEEMDLANESLESIIEKTAGDSANTGIFNNADQFQNAGFTRFGSGWAWLILKDGKLEIMKTSNADTPIAHGLKPILTVDVWEHAYYLDYQNRRADYLAAFFENLINWDFVNSCLD